MDSWTDQQLLHAYASQARESEAAFSELVRRHIDFVYSAALRLVKNAHLAEDVSQKVFLALARDARSLADCAVLAGWLHGTTRNLSANAIRSEVRRRTREQEAGVMNELLASENEPAWDSIAPHLDEVMSRLSEADRDAIFLRYFQRRSAHEMAAALGTTTEAAQKRVNRAVERLRSLFAQRGIATSGGALAMLVSANAVQTAPVGLPNAIYAAALGGAAIQTTAGFSTAKIILMTTLQKTLVASMVLAAVGAGIYAAHEHAQKNRQSHATEKQGSKGPKAPLLQVSNTVAALAASHAARPSAAARKSAAPAPKPAQGFVPTPFTSTEMYALLKSKNARLTMAQAEPYLKANARNSASLLAAFRTTGDLGLLAEAQQKYSSDPHVDFEAAIRNEATPAQRRAALDAFKQAAPDNALGYYLSALDHFKADQVDDAVSDLNIAGTKTQFDDYSLSRIQTDEEMYRQAGYQPGEGQFIANAFLPEAHLVQLLDLGRSLVDLAAGYATIGDPESQKAALQMTLNLGRQLDDPATAQTMRWQLIGLRIERTALEAMDSGSQVYNTGQLVSDRLAQLAQQKVNIQQLTQQADPLWKQLSDADLVNYHSQVASTGEEAAVRWLVRNYARR